jgi:hypothetical protein
MSKRAPLRTHPRMELSRTCERRYRNHRDVSPTACSRQAHPAARSTGPGCVTYRAAMRTDEWSRKPRIGSPTHACAKIQVCSDCQDGLRQRSRRMPALLVDGLRYKALPFGRVVARLGSIRDTAVEMQRATEGQEFYRRV